MQRYRDYNTYLREIFGERVQRISLDAGLTCPNRDGTISSAGVHLLRSAEAPAPAP